MKICTKCKVEYPATTEFFHRDKKRKDGLHLWCKECKNKYSRKHNRKSNLKSKYGLTSEDYDNMYAEQKGRCTICGRHQSELKRRFAVDHNHKTGKIRGLLCANKCNLGLGFFDHNLEILKNAIKYLEENRNNGEN